MTAPGRLDASARLAAAFEILRQDAAHERSSDAARAAALAERLADRLPPSTGAAKMLAESEIGMTGSLWAKLGAGALIAGAVAAIGVRGLQAGGSEHEPRPGTRAASKTNATAAPPPGAPASPARHALAREAASAPEPPATPAAHVHPGVVARAVAHASDTDTQHAASHARHHGAPAATLEQELSLIEHAREAVAAQPGIALRLCRKHAALYPDGVFAQEREVLAIEALLGARRPRDAEARATRFLARFPHSAHAPRVQRLIHQTRRPAGGHTTSSTP